MSQKHLMREPIKPTVQENETSTVEPGSSGTKGTGDRSYLKKKTK